YREGASPGSLNRKLKSQHVRQCFLIREHCQANRDPARFSLPRRKRASPEFHFYPKLFPQNNSREPAHLRFAREAVEYTAAQHSPDNTNPGGTFALPRGGPCPGLSRR